MASSFSISQVEGNKLPPDGLGQPGQDSDQGILHVAVLTADREYLHAHLPQLVLQDPLAQSAADDQLPPRAKPVEGDGGGGGCTVP